MRRGHPYLTTRRQKPLARVPQLASGNTLARGKIFGPAVKSHAATSLQTRVVLKRLSSQPGRRVAHSFGKRFGG